MYTLPIRSFKNSRYIQSVVPVFIWFGLAIRAIVLTLLKGPLFFNNFLIYRYVFFHTLYRQNLYAAYPKLYFDSNHYGPLFSLLIAPFALMPVYAGCFLWCMANACVLMLAINQLPLKKQQKGYILLIGAVELQTAVHDTQVNPMIAACILLSFTLVEKKKDFWAAFFIVAATFIKLYGIAGLCFFCFSRQKTKFIASILFWSLLLFCLPMLISSQDFILKSYSGWLDALVAKNAQNIDILDEDYWQDISVMGMIRRIFRLSGMPNYTVLVPAAIVYIAALYNTSRLRDAGFRLQYLAFILLGVVLFSSSAEASTYIIASAGAGIWFSCLTKKTWQAWLLLATTFLVSNFFTNHVFPLLTDEPFIFTYSLKALPYFIIWCCVGLRLVLPPVPAAGNRYALLKKLGFHTVPAENNGA